MKKKFEVKKRKVVFSKGPIHLVDCDVKMPNGLKLSRQIIEHPGAAVIIPQIKKNTFLLIKQFRFAAKDWLWEFPAGGVEKRETPRKAANRELREEVGYRAKKLTRILDFYPTPGISGEIMHLFLAENLVPDKAKGDDDEEIEVHAFTFREIERMIKQRKIVDGKTILSFLCLKHRFSAT